MSRTGYRFAQILLLRLVRKQWNVCLGMLRAERVVSVKKELQVTEGNVEHQTPSIHHKKNNDWLVNGTVNSWVISKAFTVLDLV